METKQKVETERNSDLNKIKLEKIKMATTVSSEKSRMGSTWVGGPTNTFQKQRIPGYTGHVHGLISENVVGKPYGKVTADCLENKIQRGFIIAEDERMRTNYLEDFKHPNIKKTLFTRTAADTMNQPTYQNEIIDVINT